MTIELGVWRIDQGLSEVHFEPMTAEARLEGLLAENIGIAALHLMVIGRQVRSAFDKVTSTSSPSTWGGNLAVLELKKDKTYRDIVRPGPGLWLLGSRAARRGYRPPLP